MFCGQCGAQNDDGAVHCANCGALLNGEQPQTPTPGTDSTTPSANSTTIGGITIPLSRNRLIVGAVFVVAVILAIVLIVSFVGGGGAKGTAEKYIKAYLKGDAKTFVSVLVPDWVDELCERQNIDMDEYIENRKDLMDETFESLDDNFDKWKVNYEVTKEKEMKKSERNSLEKSYESMYGIELEIEEGVTVTVKVTLAGDGEDKDAKTDISVIKVNGKWYVDSIQTRDMSATLVELRYSLTR